LSQAQLSEPALQVSGTVVAQLPGCPWAAHLAVSVQQVPALQTCPFAQLARVQLTVPQALVSCPAHCVPHVGSGQHMAGLPAPHP
jgi:hypothetical protein